MRPYLTMGVLGVSLLGGCIFAGAQNSIDISALLDLKDERLSFGWRSVYLQEGKLKIGFPNPSYTINLEKSTQSEDGRVWALYLARDCTSTIQLLVEREIPVPDGVKKIVYGTVEQCPR